MIFYEFLVHIRTQDKYLTLIEFENLKGIDLVLKTFDFDVHQNIYHLTFSVMD